MVENASSVGRIRLAVCFVPGFFFSEIYVRDHDIGNGLTYISQISNIQFALDVFIYVLLISATCWFRHNDPSK